MLIKQIVLYLGRKGTAKSKMHSSQDFGYFKYEYKLINTSDIPYQKFLGNKETLIFAILGNFPKGKSVEMVDEIMEESRKYFHNTALSEFATDLAILAELRGLAETVIVNYNTHKPTTNMPIDIDITKTYLYKQGEKQGEKKVAKAKLDAELEIAQAMLLDKMLVAQIMKFTRLTLEQIETLQKELNT